MDNYVPNGVFSPENPTIPTAYTDGYSLKEEVGKLIVYVNGLYQSYLDNTTQVKSLQDDYNKLITDINNLKTELENYESGSFIFNTLLNAIKENLENWIAKYMYDLHKFVSFGLTTDGHFCAFIPTTWKDIQFDTNDEGHLILRF